ncbi:MULTISPECIES: cbb3-type cytochrome oxidase subunit 3 [Dyella]|uniref:Cbb3-type cytochrome c oxidase subunit 3 n=2 Tax=Dyella TaxID=231454 RepID=A0A4R0Z3X3_9GAMM|nr:MULTISPECIES: cbb3-type cytochrome c oxidase subunit 3 [Dyella]TBR39342.1 cbb3-type cytochrome c oxidase subunit 3 [Dyella terrae]TCI13070.1 cbb3-type cytochrome c oxidase subunit 3 [Dyella soli]
MSAIWGHLTGVLITLIMFAFIAIWIWAWSGRHKRVFDRMAELPMEDDVPPATTSTASDDAKDGRS